MASAASPLPVPSNDIPTNVSTLQSAQDYYGRVVQKTSDLRTSACCSNPSGDRRVRAALKRVHPEVCDKYYGCGSPIPPLLNNSTVLDLGCGTGRDCFVLSQLGGSNGKVIGLDATQSQLEVGRAVLSWHKKENPGSAPIDFIQGDMSNMRNIVEDACVDVVVSNCVLNLTSDKEAVFSEIARVMRQGGELLFSDIFASEPLDPTLQNDPVLHGECLAGAHYLPELQEQLATLGLSHLRIMASTPVDVHDEELRGKLGESVTFTSLTVRAFKGISPEQNDNWKAEFLGDEDNKDFTFDENTVFSRPGDTRQISGEVAGILSKSRYAPLFRVQQRSDNEQTLSTQASCCKPKKACC